MRSFQEIDYGALLGIMGSMGLSPAVETAVKPKGKTPAGAGACPAGLAASAVAWDIMGRKARLSYMPDRRAVRFSIADTGQRFTLDPEDMLQAVNHWNFKETGSRSHVDDAGLASLESDLELAGGVSEARVRDFIANCVSRSERWISRMSVAAGWGQDGDGPETRTAGVISSLTAPELLEILKSAAGDASFELPPDSSGLVVMRIDGSTVTVMIGPGGTMLLIRHALSRSLCSCSLSDVNGWNGTRSLSRSFIDPEGAAVLESDLDLRGGVTRRKVRAFVKGFLLSIEAWTEEIILPNRLR
jgi:hypothetical protein